MYPRVVLRGTKEYKNLEAVAGLLTAFSPNNARYVVGEVYFDFDQNWIWTTIVRYGYMECQILYPKMWRKILKCETLQDIAEVTIELMNSKDFLDWSEDDERRI